MSATRVLVAVSGGVDSAVAAALLVEQGYQVICAMFQHWTERGRDQGRVHSSTVSQAAARAQRIAN